ncbi:uncharacterized protein LOC142344271 isoform X3 [Convolutriloba macropyga]|uniref:uncharacterized protein LOC142344271 isoform X3 n=1 Tax=Convolutriloba macropyga TaxID=536237 RepID=UPI003F52345C
MSDIFTRQPKIYQLAARTMLQFKVDYIVILKDLSVPSALARTKSVEKVAHAIPMDTASGIENNIGEQEKCLKS